MRAEVQIAPLREEDLGEATALLARALCHDGVSTVAREKLFGDNGPRVGAGGAASFGARTPDGRLAGIVSLAGRYIKLLAVDKSQERQGIGQKLLQTARAHRDTLEKGHRLRYCDHPGNYLSPGLDQRYQAGHAFLLSQGFLPRETIVNLRAPLRGNPLVTRERAADLARACAERGYAIRRVAKDDAAPLLHMIGEAFSPVWAFEVARALGGDDPGDAGSGSCVHAAYDANDRPVAFAAHDGNNRGLGWFGPMGTLPAHRGQGLGEALLLPCLLDVAELPEGGVIAWVGPGDFYLRACGAVLDRQFVVYEEE